jgi:hypothetical protein
MYYSLIGSIIAFKSPARPEYREFNGPCPEKIPLSSPLQRSRSLIFLSPPWERIEVRGNDPRTSFHPHPDPLPSREREIFA